MSVCRTLSSGKEFTNNICSYATGNYKKCSDIDIVLVSDIFMGNRIEDKDKIRNITLSISWS